MILSRRRVFGLGGGLIAALALPPHSVRAADGIAEITMTGTGDGARVWFDPAGLHVEPGQTIRWTNRDPSNVHTATAYHPANDDHPLRIPRGAKPWDSGYIRLDRSFSVVLTRPGVYDYYCIPHEMAGMVGRIIVGRPSDDGWQGVESTADGVPEAARHAFPTVADILERGIMPSPYKPG